MAKMRAAVVTRAGGPIEMTELEIPEPGYGQVRVKVQACGVCHSDSVVKDNLWPGLTYPRVPGHEVVGIVDKVGEGADWWKPGQRVGIGWHGGHCGHCNNCRAGHFTGCTVNLQVTGVSFNGGYAEYLVAPAIALALVPDGLSPFEAAPLMCAGITVFNAMRNTDARAGDLVAVLGLGGLGHLAVQYASKMGFRTVGIARGEDKGPFAKELGAHHYIDSKAEDPAAALQKLGGAKVILATVTAGDAMSATQGGLGHGGTMVLVGAVPKMEINPIFLLAGNRSIKGWYSGTAADSQDTLNFSALSGVRSMNEEFPLDKAPEAYERMISGKARFRVVLKVG